MPIILSKGIIPERMSHVATSGRIRVKPARNEFTGAVRIIHHIQWLYHVDRDLTQGLRLAQAIGVVLAAARR